MTDADHDVFDYCAYCGDSLDDQEWHPVRRESDENDDVTWYTFCDDECRTAWAGEE